MRRRYIHPIPSLMNLALAEHRGPMIVARKGISSGAAGMTSNAKGERWKSLACLKNFGGYLEYGLIAQDP